jgi:hypothetical protein
VRQDLRARHRERHTARGSHLQKQEQYGQISESCREISSPPDTDTKQPITTGISENQNSLEDSLQSKVISAGVPLIPSFPLRPTVKNRLTESRLHPLFVATQTNPDQEYPTSSSPGYAIGPASSSVNGYGQHFAYPALVARKSGNGETESDKHSAENSLNHGEFESYSPRRGQILSPLNGGILQPSDHASVKVAKLSSTHVAHAKHVNAPQSRVSSGKERKSCASNHDFRPPPPLTQSSISSVPITSKAGQRNYTKNVVSLTPVQTHNTHEAPDPRGLDINSSLMDSYGNISSTPVFGVHGYGLSPTAMAEDFTLWLFSAPHLSNVTPVELRHGSLSIGQTALVDGSGNLAYGGEGGIASGQYVQPVPQQHPMAVNNILVTAVTPTILSDEKRKQLIDLIDSRFVGTDHGPVSKQKMDILGGDRNADGHVLSLKMMKTYIGSYWYHFHPQMPILHQPTFSSDQTKNLLLLVVIAIGASSLDKLHGESATAAGAGLSDYLVWHLRDEIFKNVDFLPPAKLWVFQTLILLEIYEKMYSTRTLHERAHIHHGTTLTLMRRGSSLIGRSVLDSPPIAKDDCLGSTSANNYRGHKTSTPEQWWNYWITNEATRRVAFAAFIIDSIHATMFGHAATMVAHEMKLQLPCDESAWSATSSAEVGRIETNLHARGIKPITFFDGLRHTLNHKPVRTNPFGRTALMAGLLSVSWHMNQRDMQVRSLGALKALGGKDIWRGTLTKAFDSWRNDFEESIGKDSATFSGLFQAPTKLNDDIIFESKTVLHHLAHMATHVDIVNCQIFAKASRLLGRTTFPADYIMAQKRIKENWAPKASARHATFFALKFLALALLPDPADPDNSSARSKIGEDPEDFARNDFLLNRPWVLYFAALTIWSYGFALDGQVRCVPELDTFEQQKNDMRQFLERFGGIRSPGELENMRGRNACIGMLLVLQRIFRKCRWELVHEAASLLTNCIDMLKGV